MLFVATLILIITHEVFSKVMLLFQWLFMRLSHLKIGTNNTSWILNSSPNDIYLLHQGFRLNLVKEARWALAYFSGPWENILTYWQYLRIWFLRIANKTSLTLPDQSSIPFPNPTGATFPCLSQFFTNFFLISTLSARWHLQKDTKIRQNKFRDRLSTLEPQDCFLRDTNNHFESKQQYFEAAPLSLT